MARRVEVLFVVWVPDGDDLDCAGDALERLAEALPDVVLVEPDQPGVFVVAVGDAELRVDVFPAASEASRMGSSDR